MIPCILGSIGVLLLVASPVAAEGDDVRKPPPPASAKQMPIQGGAAQRIRDELGSKNIPLRGTSSYLPVVDPKPFADVRREMSAAKPDIMRKHQALLESRYDLSDRPAS